MDWIRTKEEEDNLLLDYLLGRLPPAEETRIELDFVASASLQDKLVRMEDELVDRYLEGQLSQDERRQLEARFLASPRGQRKLELARSLVLLATEAAKDKDRKGAKSGRPLPLFFQPLMRLVLATLALALLFVVGWSIKERLARGNHQNQTHSSPRPKPEPVPSRGDSPQAAAIASVVLKPVSREVVYSPEVTIHSGTNELRVELELKGNRKTYAARLLNAAGQVKWSGHDLEAQPTESGQFLILTFPAPLFESGEYTILLSPTENPAMSIAEYSFLIRKARD